MTPEWFVFTRLFVTRHNKFMFKVRHGFYYVLDQLEIRYVTRKGYLYFESDSVVERVTSSDVPFLRTHRKIIATILSNVGTMIDLKYVNSLESHEIYLLSTETKVNVGKLLLDRSYIETYGSEI